MLINEQGIYASFLFVIFLSFSFFFLFYKFELIEWLQRTGKTDITVQPVRLSAAAGEGGGGRSPSVFLSFRFVACLPR